MSRMPVHRIRVKVRKTDGKWALDVDESGNDNSIGKHPNPQLISWELQDKENNYRFVEMSHDPPGFSWFEPTSKNEEFFSKPELCKDCGNLTMDDWHQNNASRGDYIYTLRVWISDSEWIETQLTDPVIREKASPGIGDTYDPCALRFLVTTNPRIKNT